MREKITVWWIRNANVLYFLVYSWQFLLQMSKNSIIAGKLSPYLLFPIHHFSVRLLRGKSKKIHFAPSFSHNRRRPQISRMERKIKFVLQTRNNTFLFFLLVEVVSGSLPKIGKNLKEFEKMPFFTKFLDPWPKKHVPG